MTNAVSYSIGSFVITKADNILKISLNKKERKRVVFFLIFSPVIYIAICIWVFTLLRKDVPFFAASMGIVLFALFSFNFFYSLHKTYINFKSIVFSKKDGFVFLNGRKLCHLSDIKNVIVKPKANFYQVVVPRSTIGLHMNGKGLPVSYDHLSKNAFSVASIFSDFFNCPVVEKRINYLSLVTRW